MWGVRYRVDRVWGLLIFGCSVLLFGLAVQDSALQVIEVHPTLKGRCSILGLVSNSGCSLGGDVKHGKSVENIQG